LPVHLNSDRSTGNAQVDSYLRCALLKTQVLCPSSQPTRLISFHHRLRSDRLNRVGASSPTCQAFTRRVLSVLRAFLRFGSVVFIACVAAQRCLSSLFPIQLSFCHCATAAETLSLLNCVLAPRLILACSRELGSQHWQRSSQVDSSLRCALLKPQVLCPSSQPTRLRSVNADGPEFGNCIVCCALSCG